MTLGVRSADFGWRPGQTTLCGVPWDASTRELTQRVVPLGTMSQNLPHHHTRGQAWVSPLGHVIAKKSTARQTQESSVSWDASLISCEELEEGVLDSAT